MAGRAEPAAGPMAASSTAGEQEPQARAGRKLSAASRAKIQEALDAHGRGMAEHKKCARTLTDMIEAIEEDIMEDTEGDEDGKNADAGSRSLSAHVADLLRHRSAP